MKKMVIAENEMGICFKNGCYEKIVSAGSYTLWGGRSIEKCYIEDEIKSEQATIDKLLANRDFAAATEVADVKGGQIALCYVNGIFERVLTEGRHAFFKAAGSHEFKYYTLTTEVDPSIPTAVFMKAAVGLYRRIDVEEGHAGILYIDNRFVRILEPGAHYFWRTQEVVNVRSLDMRMLNMVVNGQEILSADKVQLRVNFVISYRITDALKVATTVEDYEEFMRITAQLALRDYIGRMKLDEILEDKDGISQYVCEKLREECSKISVEVIDAGVRDIILPGAVRDILNTILIAEKKAQANVITRREEVASTRSLLNTAKLMEENPTLYKLKELECVERICEKVGNINVGGQGALIDGLVNLLGG